MVLHLPDKGAQTLAADSLCCGNLREEQWSREGPVVALWRHHMASLSSQVTSARAREEPNHYASERRFVRQLLNTVLNHGLAHLHCRRAIADGQEPHLEDAVNTTVVFDALDEIADLH